MEVNTSLDITVCVGETGANFTSRPYVTGHVVSVKAAPALSLI